MESDPRVLLHNEATVMFCVTMGIQIGGLNKRLVCLRSWSVEGNYVKFVDEEVMDR